MNTLHEQSAWVVENAKNTNKNTSLKKQDGFSIVELIVALALFAIFVSGAAILVVGAYTSTRRGEALTQAALSTQQAFEAVNSISGYQYNQLVAGDYALDDSSGEWEISTAAGTEDVIVTIADVDRDSSNDIATSGTDDPHTRFLTTTVNYEVNEANSRTIEASQYITDWGASSTGETTEAQFNAGTSTNIEVTAEDDGEIRIAPDAYMEIGTVSSVDGTAQTVNLDNTYTDPVVVAVHLQDNNTAPITTRVVNVTSTSFDLYLQEAALSPGTVSADDVYYMVVEAGSWTFGDDDTLIQAGTIETDIVSSGLGTGWISGDQVNFPTEFNSDPVVLHQVMTENSTDWISSYVGAYADRSNPPTTTEMQVSLHGAEVTDVHQSSGADVAETVGWIAIDGGVTSSIDGTLSFETVVTPDEVTHTGSTYTYSASYTDPQVLISKMEEDGSNGAFHMLDDVSTTDATMHSEEDTENDAEQIHTTETFGYAVFDTEQTVFLTQAAFEEPPMEVGEYTFDSGTDVIMESGITSADGSSWTTVSFTNTGFTDPIVVAKQLESNNTTPVSVRVDNVTSTSFDVILQAPDGSTPSSEDVYFIAVERGAWEIEGHLIEADSASVSTVAASSVVSGTWAGDSKTYSHSYSAAPIVLHQVMSANDTDWITSTVMSPTSRANPPTTAGFQIALNGTQVTNTHGSAEEIGWIVIEDNLDFEYDGVDIETGRDNLITGHDTGCVTNTYNTINSSNAFAVISQLEMDGGDGSWGVICSHSATSIGMHAEEDQVFDSERWHTSEFMGWVAFSDELSVNAAAPDDWAEISLQNTYASPVVVITGYETATSGPWSPRVQNIDSNSFEVTLQAPDGTLRQADSLHYIVIEEGQWQIGSTLIEADSKEISTVAASTTLGSTWSGDSQSYGHTYSSNPIVLHQVMTYEDSDWITSWVSQQGDRTDPPDTTGFQIALNGAQVTATHDPETIGWIVVENTGSDTHAGVDFVTGIEDPGMSGHDNGCTSVTHGSTFTDPIVAASQLEMDGADGGWLIMCDLTSTTAGFHSEEDQAQDSERSHTTEAFGYLIFDQAFDDAGSSSAGASATYVSSAFGSFGNAHIIEWTEDDNGCSTCDIQLQVRTAETVAGLSSASWYGPTGEDTYFEEPTGQMLHTDHLGDSYLQFRVLFTGSGSNTSILNDVTFFYTP